MLKDWNIQNMTGYQPITTYYTDFSYAEKYREFGINQLFNQAFEDLSKDPDLYYKELTELVMVLNWKIWEHYETDEELGCTISGNNVCIFGKDGQKVSMGQLIIK